MEIAIPLIALGGMYVISNQNNKSCDIPPINRNNRTTNNNRNNNKENFTTMGRQVNYLPNTNIPPQNYPVSNIKEVIDTVEQYENPNSATDKYFDQNKYEQIVNQGGKVGQNPQQIYSLTGNYLDSAQFKHNNMVPFNGGKVKGNTYNTNIAESVLDNMIGSGSQIIKKIEQAPLFKPEDNVQWAYGAPNQSDFMQSRVVPGMKNNNVKPFESEYVGPGLNKGFSSHGTGGFNSGMEARDKWVDYTVDQLRVSTNPKLEYTLNNLEGPANSTVKNVGLIGRVEKQTPDTFFINSQDRWLTTTGAEKGETQRSEQELGIIRRNDCASNYSGVAGNNDRQAGYAPTSFEASKKTQLEGVNVNHSTAVGCGPITDGDNNLKSHKNYNNNRSTVKQPDSFRSGFSAAVGAVIAPLVDMLRPTRKEEVCSNVRIYGEAGSAVPQSYVNNPNDTTGTTIKETTIYSPEFYINNQKEGIYVNNEMPGELTQRDTTSCSYIGTSGGQATGYGDMNYAAAYNQHNNDIKSSTIGNRANQGGTQIFNQQMNVNCYKQDTNRYDCRVNGAAAIVPKPPSVKNYGKQSNRQQYDESVNCARIQPDLLNAFRNNPYTHSLTTSV
jgi:hypothetical protein